MLNIDIDKFEIVFFEKPQGDNYGEVRNPELEEPITIRLDKTCSNDTKLLHMEFINGSEEHIKDLKERIKKTNLSNEGRCFLETIMTALSYRIIFVNHISLMKLMNNEIDALCALYHELGHMVYYDESQHNNEGKRKCLIEEGFVSADELLADEYSYMKFGDNVCETLEKQIEIAKELNDESKDILIKEYELRLKHLKEKYSKCTTTL